MAGLKSIIDPLYYLLGWHTNRKLIVIASDDWGGIRVRSNEYREKLQSAGFNMSGNRFNRFDTLESDDDLSNLFAVLKKFTDKNGNHPVFTAMTNVANPDFDKIRDDDFRNYHFEPFKETLQRYPNHANVFDLYLEGIETNIFVPQFHGREHVNVNRWMKALRDNHHATRKAFELCFFQPEKSDLGSDYTKGFGAAFDVDSRDDISSHTDSIRNGLELFQKLFDYRAACFTAPALLSNPQIEPTLASGGIKIIDVPKFEKFPAGGGQYKKRINYIGKKNAQHQIYVTRTALFEPNMNENTDHVDRCLFDIATAFKNRKPAIISNHRAAFTGGLDPKNRTKGLAALEKLLGQILHKWPEAEFIEMSTLYKIILNA